MGESKKANDDYCIDIVKKVIEDKTGIFDEVYYDFILKLILNINNKILALNIDSKLINKDEILISIGKAFKKLLISLLEKTLISELYTNKENLKGDTPEDRYYYFINCYMKENKDEIFKESSIIRELIELNIANVSDSVNEFFERIKSDAVKIEKNFNLNIYNINKIDMSCGDTHNNGRTVFIVTLDQGEKIVYKPHSLKNDIILNNIVEFINNKKALRCDLKTAVVIDCGGYGWQKFVKFTECKTEKEVRNYMYRIGELICLCYTLKTNDLHFENIIASGEYPIIIDSETLSYNSSFFRSGYINLIGGILKVISDSVYSSVLLPQNLEFNPKKLELSAIAGGYVNQSYTVNTVTNEGTDNIQFNYKEVSLNETQDLKNIVTLNGDKIDILEYAEDIVAGFKDYYKILLENKEELIKFMNIDENFDGEYRQVLRATALYSKYLRASYHPYYTVNDEMREKVFNCLNAKITKFEKQREMIEAEKAQLRKDDIPYFFAKYNSLDLYTHTEGIISNFYTKTIKDILIDKVKSLSKEDLEKQELFIRFSLSGVKGKDDNSKDTKKVQKFKDVKYKDNFKETIYNLLISMNDFQNKLYSISDENRTYYSFYNLSHTEEGYMLGSIKSMLYEGLGIILNYAYLYEYTKEDKYKEILDKMLETSSDFDLFKGNIGAFSGLAGLLYVNYNLYKIFNEDKYYKKYKEIIDYLLYINLDEIKEIDVTSGLSGVIIMLLNIYKNDDKEISALNLALKYGEELIERAKLDKENINTGFAHGLSGISAALIMLFNFNKKFEYYNLAMNLIKLENKYYVKEENSYLDLREENKVSKAHWCYGATGILVSRSLILDYVLEEDIETIAIDIERCTDKIVKDGLDEGMLNNLCHGNIGNLDILLELAIKTNNEVLMNLIMEKSEKIIKDIIENGLNVSNPVACINIDFMTGLSGVIYFLLRLLNKDIPSVLYLESIK